MPEVEKLVGFFYSLLLSLQSSALQQLPEIDWKPEFSFQLTIFLVWVDFHQITLSHHPSLQWLCCSIASWSKCIWLCSVNVNCQGWRTSLETSWCQTRARLGLKLSGLKHYLHVDSHTNMDLEWGSWLLRQRAQTWDPSFHSCSHRHYKRACAAWPRGLAHAWAFLPKAVSHHARDWNLCWVGDIKNPGLSPPWTNVKKYLTLNWRWPQKIVV